MGTIDTALQLRVIYVHFSTYILQVVCNPGVVRTLWKISNAINVSNFYCTEDGILFLLFQFSKQNISLDLLLVCRRREIVCGIMLVKETREPAANSGRTRDARTSCVSRATRVLLSVVT
jgi:hypothetical protein